MVFYEFYSLRLVFKAVLMVAVLTGVVWLTGALIGCQFDFGSYCLAFFALVGFDVGVELLVMDDFGST